jgi:hypothetical protein
MKATLTQSMLHLLRESGLSEKERRFANHLM